MWDNDSEVLMYRDDSAYVINSSKVARKEICENCCKGVGAGGNWKWVRTNAQVREMLNMSGLAIDVRNSSSTLRRTPTVFRGAHIGHRPVKSLILES
jgi:hypothetical protein